MKKRVFSIFLVLTMVITLFSNAIFSFAGLSEIDVFVDELYEMDQTDTFMELVETFWELSDDARLGFKDEVTDIAGAIDKLHDYDVPTDYDVITNNIIDFVEQESVTQETINNMKNYISTDNSSNRSAMTDAFTSRGIQFTDLNDEDIRRSVQRLDKILYGLKVTGDLEIQIIARSQTGSYSKRSAQLNNLIDVYINLYDGQEDGRSDAISAFDSLIIYYNGLGSSDRSTIHGFFDKVGLVYQTPSTSPTPSPTPDPEEEDDFDNAIEDQDTTTAGDILEESASTVETEEEAEKVLDNTSTLINTASDTLSESLDEAEEQIEKVAQTVDLISTAMDKIEDSVKAEEKAAVIMESISNMKTKAEVSGAETSSLDKAAENLARKVAEKAGTTSATSTKEGTKATADLSSLDLSEQIQKTKSAADNMSTKLEENKIQRSKQKVETKVTINVETDEDVNEVDVTVPNLDKAFETVDKVKVSSRVASFELEKDTIETRSDDNYEERINLNAKKPTAEELEDIKSNLAPGQSIPEGAEVINLTASVKRVNRNTGQVESTTPVTKFKQRIKVSVPYTLKEGENPKEISVFLVQDDGTVKKVGGVYNPATKQVEFSRSTFSNYYVAASRVTFEDTTDLEVMYKDAIEILAGKGLVAGRTADIYDPDALVTRAEFIVLIARMLELESDPADLPFNDVDNDNAWFRNHLAGAYNAGIINGTSATTFHPQNNITRQEAAAIVVNAARFLGYNDADGSVIATRYQDHAQIAPWAVRSVATVHRDKLAAGMYVGNFMPKEAVTRDETAVLIYNMLFEY